jgi:hypothetical protein
MDETHCPGSDQCSHDPVSRLDGLNELEAGCGVNTDAGIASRIGGTGVSGVKVGCGGNRVFALVGTAAFAPTPLVVVITIAHLDAEREEGNVSEAVGTSISIRLPISIIWGVLNNRRRIAAVIVSHWAKNTGVSFNSSNLWRELRVFAITKVESTILLLLLMMQIT